MKQKQSFSMWALGLLLVVAVTLASCTSAVQQQNNSVPTQELKKFSSTQELAQFLAQQQANGRMDNSAYRSALGSADMALSESAAPSAAPSIAKSEDGVSNSAIDYSNTNVQIEGVDEADIIKTDGSYIYLIADNTLIIVDARDPSKNKIVGKYGFSTVAVNDDGPDPRVMAGSGTSSNTVESTEAILPVQPTEQTENQEVEVQQGIESSTSGDAGTTSEDAEISSKAAIASEYYDSYYYEPQDDARDLFINGDKVIVLVNSYKPTYYFTQYDVTPQRTYASVLEAIIFDVSDRTDPQVEERISISGSYQQSRMIGDKVYVITQEGAQYPIARPLIAAEGRSIMPDVYYFDNPEDNYVYTTVASIDIDDGDITDSKVFMMGWGNTVMVSEDHIYIAYQKQQRWYWGYGGYDKERFDQVILPNLPVKYRNHVDEIVAENLNDQDAWQKISVVLSQMWQDAENDSDLRDDLDDLAAKLQEYDVKKQMDSSKTVIHKIAIDDGNIEYDDMGEVNGYLHNQFAMDEYQGNLRVATTLSVWAQESIMHNNVYVLNDDMEVIGSLEGVAKDESIYSTRFMGDKLYMVTYRQVDPFFVVDLSDPSDPEVLGELKIPGYSSYLHPYNENFIIGVGQDGDEKGILGGVKMSLFDVSDFSNPRQVDSVVIGEEGSYTPVMGDHKSFLFSADKGIIVLPVNEVTGKTKMRDYEYDYYENKWWYGAYVFSISENGFDEVGKVEHDTKDSDYYYWSPSSVMRSLYIGNTLYTFSQSMLKANDLSNDLDELSTVKLPVTNRYYGGYGGIYLE